MLRKLRKVSLLGAILLSCLSLAGCDDMRVYGSVGYSYFSGHHGGGGMGTSISVGGRIR